MKRFCRIAVVVFGLSASGCTRDMEASVCQPLAAGELVITEMRGVQRDDGADTGGQWIELYYAGEQAIELLGLQINMRRLDGSSQSRILIRQPLPIVAQQYIVLGGADAGSNWTVALDYNWYPDFSTTDSSQDDDRDLEARSLFDTGAIDIEACEQPIDRVVYADLPVDGSYSLGGEPDAERNDLPNAWCTEGADDSDPATVGLPGTPRLANRMCP